MPTILTVMGVECGGTARFCFATIRPALGSKAVPPPLLTKADKDLAAKGISWPLGCRDLALRTWSVRLEGADERAVHDELDRDRLTLPANCPFEAGVAISGERFGPLPIPEQLSDPARCAGVGLLKVDGFAVPDGAISIISVLRDALGESEVAKAVARLTAAVAKRAGLGRGYTQEQRLMAVERLKRNSDGQGPRLFSILLEKPDLASGEPARFLIFRRDAAQRDADYRLVVEAACFGRLISNAYIELAKGAAEVRHDAGTHITDVRLSVFDQAGTLVEKVEVSFGQSIGGSVVAQTGCDQLPPIRGAVASPDLQQRARLSTAAFPPISAGKRSGGIDTLQETSRFLERLTGPRAWTAAVRWFENSANNQADVIRYVKVLLENPQVSRAVLVDPYLGKDAFERVILRQGREDLELTIVISPADVDPDASELDVKTSPGAHVRKLRDAVEGFSDRTCGDLRLINIQRGEGAKQAFHDRYLLLWGPEDVPRGFLLSNSLNEAAGKWPYAVAELDRVNSWAVAGYIEGLLAGRDRARRLSVKAIWPEPEFEQRTSASVQRHGPLLAWLASDEIADATDEAGLNAWLQRQPWSAPLREVAAREAYASLVEDRWRASAFSSAERMADKLLALAEFEADVGLSSISRLGPWLEQTRTDELVRGALALLAATEADDGDDLRNQADLLFAAGPVQPTVCAAVLRAHRRFGRSGSARLLGLLLQLDASALELAMTSATPAKLRMQVVDIATELCVVEEVPGFAERLSQAQAPGLRMLSLFEFDRDLLCWTPRPGSTASVSGLETITLRAAQVVATLVRASGAGMSKVPDPIYEREKIRRDAAHALAVQELASHWPTSVDQQDAAKLAWIGIWERLETSAQLSEALRAAGHETAADCLDRITGDHVLSRLLRKQKDELFIPNALAVAETIDALRRIARTRAASGARTRAASEGSPTNFVRECLNPAVAAWMSALESDILTGDEATAATLAALAVSIIALQVAASAKEVQLAYREGLVGDYVGVLTSVLRTDVARSLVATDLPWCNKLLDQTAQVLGELRRYHIGEQALCDFASNKEISPVLRMRLGFDESGR